jgi:hypothetical protein
MARSAVSGWDNGCKYPVEEYAVGFSTYFVHSKKPGKTTLKCIRNVLNTRSIYKDIPKSVVRQALGMARVPISDDLDGTTHVLIYRSSFNKWLNNVHY